MPHPVDRRRGAGFSLVEMLVALAIFGLAVLGLLNLAGENTRTAVVVEESVLAGIVADNRAVEAMLATPTELGTEGSGIETLGGHEWQWQRTVARAPGSLLRIVVAVQEAGQARIAAERVVLREAP